MISARMNGHTGDAARATNQLLCQSLLRQVVNPDMILGGHKQEGLERVEEYPHHTAPVLAEGIPGGVLGQLMHQHCLGVACTVTQTSDSLSSFQDQIHVKICNTWCNVHWCK